MSSELILEADLPGDKVTVGRFVRNHANELGLVFATVIMYVVLSGTARNFMTPENQLNILREIAFVGIIAWGMTLVLIAGEIDISVGPHVAFAGIILAELIRQGWPVWLACVAVLVLGALIGLFAGLLRAYLSIPSFITTLALWLSLRGLAQVISKAVPIVVPYPEFQYLGQGSIFMIPVPTIIMVVLLVVFAFVARKTVFGRSVFAVGANPEAANLSGINVPKIRTIIFVLTGVLSAIVGILIASRLGSGNSGAANGMEFDVIAGVVVGGTALTGGRGTMIGTLLGVLFIGALTNGLVLMGVDPFMQSVVRGVIILVAVLVNVISTKRITGVSQ
jgi:simple sugar transport system permease protein